MFYVKAKINGINDTVKIAVELHDDNVFCVCPGCGREVGIDLAELFRDRDFDLYGTTVYCSKCSKMEGVI